MLLCPIYDFNADKGENINRTFYKFYINGIFS